MDERDRKAMSEELNQPSCLGAVSGSKGNGCKCTHCVNYDFYKWAVVMECGCKCHTDDGMTGHDGLCCSIPNGLKKNNPHKHLEKAEYYENILNEWSKDGM